MGGMLDRLGRWARGIKTDVVALSLAMRDPRVPWLVKGLGVAVVAYALSPIDLIPDFIPVIGYLDELILLPLALSLLVRLIDPAVMDECRRAATESGGLPSSRWGALIVVAIWLCAAGLLFWAFWPVASL